MQYDTKFLNFQELRDATKGRWENIQPPSGKLTESSINSVSTDSRQNCSGTLFIALPGGTNAVWIAGHPH